MDLYSGDTVTVTGTLAKVSTLMGYTVRGHKISFMRAGKDNVGTIWFRFTGGGIAGFLDAGEALSFDHPRPDAFDMWLIGTNLDALSITAMAEAVAGV